MKEIVVIGSLNMDMVVRVDRMPKIGETVMGRGFKTVPGGKGANQAVTAAKLKGDVAMIGRVGEDMFGETLLENLKKEKVDCQGIKVDEEAPTGIAMINVNREGNNNIIVAPGANEKCSIEDIDHFEEMIASAKVVVLQLEIPIETVEYAINLAAKYNVKVILNPAPAIKLKKEILEKVYLLTPNESELEILTRSKAETLSEIKLAGEKLMKMGVKRIVVTLGEQGALLMTEEKSTLVKAHRVETVDTTGAGDSFTGALAVSIAEGKDLEEAVEFANRVAAITVTREGAQTSLPTLDEVNRFISY